MSGFGCFGSGGGGGAPSGPAGGDLSGTYPNPDIAAGAIVNADINTSAAIDGTKISPNFGSQNIVTTGTSNSLGTTNIDGYFSVSTGANTLLSVSTALAKLEMPMEITFNSTDYLRIGPPAGSGSGSGAAASAGAIRLASNGLGNILWRATNDASDTASISLSNTNVLTIQATSGIVMANAVTCNSSLSCSGAFASGSTISITSGNLTFGSAGVTPTISQAVNSTATFTGAAMTINAQSASGNTSTTGGSLTIFAGDATGTGGTHNGGATTLRGGDATGASGTRNGGALTIRPGNGASAQGTLSIQSGAGTNRIQVNSTGIGFFAVAPVAQQNITGSRGGNAALANLLTGLVNLGLITDGTSA